MAEPIDHPLSLAGGITPSGGIVKNITRSLSGGITPSGLLTMATNYILSLAGGITPSGGIVKRVAKFFAGSLTPSGRITKATARTLQGSLAPSGSIVKQIWKSLVGGITPVGIFSALPVMGVTPMGETTGADEIRILSGYSSFAALPSLTQLAFLNIGQQRLCNLCNDAGSSDYEVDNMGS